MCSRFVASWSSRVGSQHSSGPHCVLLVVYLHPSVHPQGTPHELVGQDPPAAAAGASPSEDQFGEQLAAAEAAAAKEVRRWVRPLLQRGKIDREFAGIF